MADLPRFIGVLAMTVYGRDPDKSGREARRDCEYTVVPLDFLILTRRLDSADSRSGEVWASRRDWE